VVGMYCSNMCRLPQLIIVACLNDERKKSTCTSFNMYNTMKSAPYPQVHWCQIRQAAARRSALCQHSKSSTFHILAHLKPAQTISHSEPAPHQFSPAPLQAYPADPHPPQSGSALPP
jgi:hypothetical protein